MLMKIWNGKISFSYIYKAPLLDSSQGIEFKYMYNSYFKLHF